MNSQQVLSKLVACNTISSGSNLNIIDWLQDFCEQRDGVCQRIYSASKTKSNLWVRFGKQAEDGIIISGHTDIVPTLGQNWLTDPFTLTQKGNLLHGRGTCDMKGSIACALASIDKLSKSNQLKNLEKPIYLSLSYDEEVGCVGVRDLVDYVADNEPKIKACFVVEPTNLTFLRAHKGIELLHTKIVGVPAHSSQTHIGVSAVMLAGELLHWLNNKSQSLSEKPCQESFLPPYTTVHSGVIKGGTAFNIMAEHTDFYWDCRYLPQDDPEPIKHDFNKFCQQILQKYPHLPTASINTDVFSAVKPYAYDHGAEQFLVDSKVDVSFENKNAYVSYVTEAGLFQQINIPTAVCGTGDPFQAHQPNEYISIEDLQLGVEYFDCLFDFQVKR